MKDNAMKKGSRTDWKRLRQMKDETIDTGDIPELDDEFFRRAEVKTMPKLAGPWGIFEKLSSLLHIRFDNEGKPVSKSSPLPSIRESGNSET